jgi:hypothetical protein
VVADETVAQTRTPASAGQSCERCGRPLTGRKTRFCSDVCRMRDRRDCERARIASLLGQLEGGIAALRDHLVRAGVLEP